MCRQEITHFKCRHSIKSEINHCRYYHEKNAGTSPFLSCFGIKSPDCGEVYYVNLENAGVCSQACARKLIETRVKYDKAMKQQEREHRERVGQRIPEYTENKRAVRRQERPQPWGRMESDRDRKGKARQPNTPQRDTRSRQGDHTQPSDYTPASDYTRASDHTRTSDNSRSSVCTVWPSASTMYLNETPARQPCQTREEAQRAPPRLADRAVLPQAPPRRVQSDCSPPRAATQAPTRRTRSTRVEAERAPPRLSDRPILPQYRPQNPSSSRSSRTEANIDYVGRQTQGTPSQARIPPVPSANGASNPHLRSNPRQPKPVDSKSRPPITQRRAALDPRLDRPVQNVGAKQPVMVSPPRTARPQSMRAGYSSGSSIPTPTPAPRQRPPQPKKQIEVRSPVPPKDPRRAQAQPQPQPQYPSMTDGWQPQYPHMAPAPLSLRARPPNREGPKKPTAPPPSAGRPDGYRQDQSRPVPTRKPVAPSSILQERPQPSGGYQAYRPNPVFANKPQTPRTPANQVSGAGRQQPPSSSNNRSRSTATVPTAASSSRSRSRQPTPSTPFTTPSRSQNTTTTGRSRSSSRPTATQPPKPPSKPPTRPLPPTPTPAAAHQPEKKKGGGWLKRLVGAGNNNASNESLEWVSIDAARIERGPTLLRNMRVPPPGSGRR